MYEERRGRGRERGERRERRERRGGRGRERIQYRTANGYIAKPTRSICKNDIWKYTWKRPDQQLDTWKRQA